MSSGQTPRGLDPDQRGEPILGAPEQDPIGAQGKRPEPTEGAEFFRSAGSGPGPTRRPRHRSCRRIRGSRRGSCCRERRDRGHRGREGESSRQLCRQDGAGHGPPKCIVRRAGPDGYPAGGRRERDGCSAEQYPGRKAQPGPRPGSDRRSFCAGRAGPDRGSRRAGRTGRSPGAERGFGTERGFGAERGFGTERGFRSDGGFGGVRPRTEYGRVRRPRCRRERREDLGSVQPAENDGTARRDSGGGSRESAGRE